MYKGYGSNGYGCSCSKQVKPCTPNSKRLGVGGGMGFWSGSYQSVLQGEVDNTYYLGKNSDLPFDVISKTSKLKYNANAPNPSSPSLPPYTFTLDPGTYLITLNFIVKGLGETVASDLTLGITGDLTFNLPPQLRLPLSYSRVFTLDNPFSFNISLTIGVEPVQISSYTMTVLVLSDTPTAVQT